LQRSCPIPAREVLRRVLSRIRDAPRIGPGSTGGSPGAAAGTRTRHCDTASWWSSPTATSVAQPKRDSLQCNFYPGTRMRILAAQRNQTSFCSPIAAADFTWFSKLQKTVARTFMIRICQWGGGRGWDLRLTQTRILWFWGAHGFSSACSARWLPNGKRSLSNRLQLWVVGKSAQFAKNAPV
jgi:hypothetical protein